MDLSVQQEKRNQTKGKTISIIIHILLLVLLFINFMHPPDPPPGQAGILVSFGEPNIGQGDEVSAPPMESPEEEEPDKAEEEEDTDPPVEEPEVSEPEVSEAEKRAAEQKKLLEDKNSKERALQKKKDEEKRKKDAAEAKKKADAEAKKKADAERKRKAEEARKKKEAEEARKKAEADKFKGEIGGLFGQDGEGKGETGEPGNQGDPSGDPNATNLDGISTGSGDIGGNLGGRGVEYKPIIKDKSQKQGTINLKVCVDGSGKVISAVFTQGGSTTSDPDLKRTAIAGAKKYRFEESSLDKQCGTIKIKFRLK